MASPTPRNVVLCEHSQKIIMKKKNSSNRHSLSNPPLRCQKKLCFFSGIEPAQIIEKKLLKRALDDKKKRFPKSNKN